MTMNFLKNGWWIQSLHLVPPKRGSNFVSSHCGYFVLYIDVRVHSLHPGFCQSDILRHAPFTFKTVFDILTHFYLKVILVELAKLSLPNINQLYFVFLKDAILPWSFLKLVANCVQKFFTLGYISMNEGIWL